MCEGCCCARMAFLLLPAEVGGAVSLASSWQQSRLGVAGWAVFFERRRFLADLGERSKKRASWKSSELRLLSCTCKTELSRDEIGAESAAESGTGGNVNISGQPEMTGLADEPLFPFPEFSRDPCFGDRWSERDPGLCDDLRVPD